MKDLTIQMYLLHITKHFQLQNGNKFSILITTLRDDNSPAKYSRLKGISVILVSKLPLFITKKA